MEDFKKMLSELRENLSYFEENYSHLTNDFFKFMELVEFDKALDRRTKELIAVALAVVQRCKFCIGFHVKKCLDLGLSDEEILEASWVAVLMGGGPSFMYLQLVRDAINQFKKA